MRPSTDGSLTLRPCRVLLKEGRWVDRVYLVEEEPYLRQWKVPPGEDPSRRALRVESIEDVAESPARLPARFADRLYRAGESGTGYTHFSLSLSDGRRLPYQTGHAVDFPQWPDDATPDLVSDVSPHEVPGEFQHRTPGPHEGSAPHLWCLYRRPEPRWPVALAAGWALASWACALMLVERGWRALEALGAVALLGYLLPEMAVSGGAPAQGAPALALSALAVLLQAGLAAAPLVRRRSLAARLGVLGLMLPSLAFLPWILGAAGAGAWPAPLDAGARLALMVVLGSVPTLNALLLFLPRPRRASREAASAGATSESSATTPGAGAAASEAAAAGMADPASTPTAELVSPS